MNSANATPVPKKEEKSHLTSKQTTTFKQSRASSAQVLKEKNKSPEPTKLNLDRQSLERVRQSSKQSLRSVSKNYRFGTWCR